MSRLTSRFAPSLSVEILLERRRLLTLPSPGINITSGGFSAVWAGQDPAIQQGVAGADGLVHIAVSSLPENASNIQSADLTDAVPDEWIEGNTGYESGITVVANGTNADLSFAPRRDETGAQLTLRLTFNDGSEYAVQFAGGFADPGRTAQDIASGSTTVPQGANLNTFISSASTSIGTFELGNYEYDLYQPLKLSRPVKIINELNASPRLVFGVNATSPASWDDAVDIDSDHVTLQGFSISFAGQIPWAYSDVTNPNTMGIDLGVISVDQDSQHVFQDPTIEDMTIVGPTQYGEGDPVTHSLIYTTEFEDFLNKDNVLNQYWVVSAGG